MINDYSFIYSFIFALVSWVVAAVLSCVAHADELRFSNGYVVLGQVTQRADGKIYFHTSNLGDLVVPAAAATAVASTAPNAPAPAPTTPLPPPAAVAVTAPPIPARAAPHWTGKLEFGYLAQSGPVRSVNTSFRAELTKKSGAEDFLAIGRYLYGTAGSALNAERTDASFRWRHDLDGRIFLQALSSYDSDKIRMISYDADQNAGLGYHLLAGGKQTASLGGGITEQYRKAYGSHTGFDSLGEIFQDYSYKFGHHVEFAQDAVVQYSPAHRTDIVFLPNNQPVAANSAAQNYTLQFHSGVQSKLSSRFSLGLRFEYEYDNAIQDAQLRADDRLISSVLYNF